MIGAALLLRIAVLKMIENEHINFTFITRYIRNLINDDIKNLYDFAHNRDIPVAKPETTKLIYILAMIKKPKKILELGTGIGCSAAVLSKASEDARITTVEKDENNFNEAKKMFDEEMLSDRITAVNADALEFLKEKHKNNEKYDFIFLDSAKGQYIDCYPYLTDILEHGGLLVTDNVLYGGMVANDELIQHRKRTIVKRLREYLDALHTDKTLETVVVPIGDGVAVSCKKPEEDKNE